MRRFAFLLPVFALLAGACAPTLTDLQRPQTVTIPDANGRGPSDEQVLQAIRVGAARKHWVIVGEQPNVVFASVTSGGHSATVRIDYGAQGWTISLQESSPGLKYNPNYRGREVIHQRYNLWVRHLNAAIAQALNQVQTQPQVIVVPTASGARIVAF